MGFDSEYGRSDVLPLPQSTHQEVLQLLLSSPWDTIQRLPCYKEARGERSQRERERERDAPAFLIYLPIYLSAESSCMNVPRQKQQRKHTTYRIKINNILFLLVQLSLRVICNTLIDNVCKYILIVVKYVMLALGQGSQWRLEGQ